MSGPSLSEISWLRGKDLNLRPLGYAYRCSFRCLAFASLWSGLSLHPRTGFTAVRVPAVKSLHLHRGPHGPQRLARDYRATGFPDFDRKSRISFLTRSPLQDQLLSVLC